jgi:hypothetical protein
VSGACPLGIFFVHAVEQGKIQLERIDKWCFTPSALEMTSDEAGGLHSLAVGANRTQDDWHEERHLILLLSEAAGGAWNRPDAPPANH